MNDKYVRQSAVKDRQIRTLQVQPHHTGQAALQDRIKEEVYRKTHIVIFAVFGWLFLNVLLVNQVYCSKDLFNPFFVSFFGLCFLFLSVWFFRFSEKHISWFEKYEIIILFLTLYVMFSIQLMFGVKLETNPNFDFEAVYRGAIQWLNDGNLGRHQSYFCKFPNNIGCLFILKIYFQLVSFFGVKAYYLAATILDCILFEIGYLLAYKIVKRLFGLQSAMMALFLSAFILPVYFYAAIFYSDSLTFIFPVLVYYLYLKGKDAETKVLQYVFFTLSGIAAAIGMEIKLTVLFILIAIVIELLLTKKPREYLLKIGVCALAAVITAVSFQTYIYSCGILDKKTVDRARIPYSHWLMMTLKNDGSYNNEDYGYINSFKTTQEKDKAAWKMYFKRLDDYGPGRYLIFLNRKQITTWGNGTYNISEFLRTNPVHKTGLRDIAVNGGKYYSLFTDICQGIHIGIFALMILYLYSLVKRRREMKTQENRAFAAYVVLLGLYVFFLIWEANARYLIDYIPIFIIAAIPGLKALNDRIS